jgi:hypothetical protein
MVIVQDQGSAPLKQQISLSRQPIYLHFDEIVFSRYFDVAFKRVGNATVVIIIESYANAGAECAAKFVLLTNRLLWKWIIDWRIGGIV